MSKEKNVSPKLWNRLGSDVQNTLQTGLILVALIVLATILSNGTFLKAKNIINIFNQNAILMVVAFGQFFVIVLGGIDLSVGAVMALTSVLVVKFQHLGMTGAVGIGLLAGILVGILNAYLVIYRRLPTFIVTLATMEIVYSVAKMISGGAAVYTSFTGVQIDEGLQTFYKSSVLGISVPVLICLIIWLLLFLYLKSRWGSSLFAVGANESAARLSGISTPRVKMCAHIIASFLCSVAGVMFVARVAMGDPNTGDSQQIDSIAAVTIGGASLSGGTGTLIGTVLGVLILSALSNVMSLLHIPSTIQPAIKGLAILLAVFFNTYKQSSK
jgi:ribose transport system permease protein